MKVEKARKKICPMLSRVGGDLKGIGIANCEGGKCMAWRWVLKMDLEKVSGVVTFKGQKESERDGYCGLAGKPGKAIEVNE